MNRKRKMFVWRLLSGTLALLGFTACSKDDPAIYPCEYGSPTVDYQVKGKVTSNEGEPLKGIRVIVKDVSGVFMKDINSPSYGADTVYTDEKGEFASHMAHSGFIEKQKIFLNDIDGEENSGAFKPDSVAFEKMDKKQVKEGGKWYEGQYELNTTVKLFKESKKE